ncbi:MAG: FAD binding domain-containing protein [Chloroflexota bacterium]
MYRSYHAPKTLNDVLKLKAELGSRSRVIAGGTDLLIELDRGNLQTSSENPISLIDLSKISGLSDITITNRSSEKWVELGPLVTHNQCVASQPIVEYGFPLARACWEVGAPQIRNRATIAGNLITASPANDTIAPLIALHAEVTIESAQRGERTLPLVEFITGFRQVDLDEDEILTKIAFPTMSEHQRGIYIKLGLRRAQAISVVSLAIVVDIDPLSVMPLHAKWAGTPAPQIRSASIALGSVAPVIVQAKEAETFLQGKVLTDDIIEQAASLALNAANPIDDVRATAEYRLGMVKALVQRGLRQIQLGQEQAGWAEKPVTLWGKTDGRWPVQQGKATPNTSSMAFGDSSSDSDEVATLVNDQPVKLLPSMTLLNSLRAAGFVGVKEGCAEGECGSCTVFLDGMAVMACMVPSERAQASHVTTIEGLGNAEQLHLIQQAFVNSGGVQCGYCTPGFIMSAAKLLEERPQPTRGEAQEALTGNLCRCTGYRKIIDAIMMAQNAQKL